mgnify:FL=1|tara:strand:- start:1966 stop:2139 length:174 start_codon:yes stop_codon:yes gene_type:complete
MDDRISIHYVVDRLEDILKKHQLHMPQSMFKDLDEFRRECIYNLGVNTRIRRDEGEE